MCLTFCYIEYIITIISHSIISWEAHLIFARGPI